MKVGNQLKLDLQVFLFQVQIFYLRNICSGLWRRPGGRGFESR